MFVLVQVAVPKPVTPLGCARTEHVLEHCRQVVVVKPFESAKDVAVKHGVAWE